MMLIEHKDRCADKQDGAVSDVLAKLKDIVHYEVLVVTPFLNDSTAAKVAFVTPINC
jgi:hypothetical protein